VDLGRVAACTQDAAERAGMIGDVPIAIEVRLNLGRHPDGAVLVTGRECRAEGSQLGRGAEFAGLVVPAALFRAAIETLNEIDGAWWGSFVSASIRLTDPKASSPPGSARHQSETRHRKDSQRCLFGAYFSAVSRVTLRARTPSGSAIP